MIPMPTKYLRLPIAVPNTNVLATSWMEIYDSLIFHERLFNKLDMNIKQVKVTAQFALSAITFNWIY